MWQRERSSSQLRGECFVVKSDKSVSNINHEITDDSSVKTKAGRREEILRGLKSPGLIYFIFFSDILQGASSRLDRKLTPAD